MCMALAVLRMGVRAGGPRSQARRFWYPKGAPPLRRKNKKLKRIFFFKGKERNKKERNQRVPISN